MKYSDAFYVLNLISTGNMPPTEIRRVVRKILNMATVNAVTKNELLNAVRWLIDELDGLHKLQTADVGREVKWK